MPDLVALNALDRDSAAAAFKRCCGSTRWAESMADARPFESDDQLLKSADAIWATMDREDVFEAFSHHPKIGADIGELRKKFAATAGWSAGEQSGVTAASEDVLERLRDGNVAYEKRHGYIFIVCATGKSASEMLEILEARIGNDLDTEFIIARGEQAKITRIRLEKLELDA